MTTTQIVLTAFAVVATGILASWVATFLFLCRLRRVNNALWQELRPRFWRPQRRWERLIFILSGRYAAIGDASLTRRGDAAFRLLVLACALVPAWFVFLLVGMKTGWLATK